MNSKQAQQLVRQRTEDLVSAVNDAIMREHTRLWYTNPGGALAYSYDSDEDVVYDDGEPRPDTPPDQSVTRQQGAATVTRSSWTRPPWSGWHEVSTLTIEIQPPPQPV